MASFVESATLLVKDKSTDEIKQINRALAKLFKTAKALKSTRASITITGTSPERIAATARALASLKRASDGVKNVNANVNVRGTDNLKRAVSALQRLNRLTSTTRTGGPLPLVSAADMRALNALQAKVQIVNAELAKIGATGPNSGLRNIANIVGTIKADAFAIRNALAGIGRLRAQPPGSPPPPPRIPPPPRSPRQPQQFAFGLIPKPRWGVVVGRDVGTGFRASVGAWLFQGLDRAARSAGQGILTADDAQAIARASGVDVNALIASATRATTERKGVSTGLLVEAGTEQAGQLTALFKSGAITQQEFNTRLDTMTNRIASNAEILTTFLHSAERAAEGARQLEKVLQITGVNVRPEEAAKMNEAALRAFIATGGDIAPEEIKRLLQQLGGTLRQALSPEGLTNAILLRDEGGRQSTAEIRTAMQDLFRGDLNDEDKNRQIAAGLRDSKGETVFSKEEFGDPIGLLVNQIVPLLKKMNVATDPANADPIKIANALDSRLGFTGPGARLAAAIIPQLEQFSADIARAAAIQPSMVLQEPTLRTQLADVEAKFQDAAVRMTKDMMPQIKNATDGLSDILGRVSRDETTSSDVAKLGAAGIAAGAIAMFDPSTRSLGAAGIALTASAAALTTAATALGGAAIVQGAAGVAGFFKGVGTNILGISGILAFVETIKAARDKLEAQERLPGDKNAMPRGTFAKLMDKWMVKKKTPDERETAAISAAIATSIKDVVTQLQSVPPDLTKAAPFTDQEKTDIDVMKQWDSLLPSMTEGATKIQGAFDLGGPAAGTAVQSALQTGGVSAGTSIGSGLTQAAPGAGSALGQGLMGVAPSVGAAIGNAAAAAINNNVRVNVNVNQTQSNTGSNAPVE